MVAKPKYGSFGLRLCVPGPGDPVMGAHSARSHRTYCSMASKTMKFELVGRRRDAPTASNPGSRRVSTPPYRNPGYKPSDDASYARGQQSSYPAASAQARTVVRASTSIRLPSRYWGGQFFEQYVVGLSVECEHTASAAACSHCHFTDIGPRQCTRFTVRSRNAISVNAASTSSAVALFMKT